ncbi:Hexokinase-2 [Dirofilaria immitis]
MAPYKEDEVKMNSTEKVDGIVKPHCASNVHVNLHVSKVVVHPLVLLSVVDHFNRVSKTQNVKRVVGVLLGSIKSDRTLDIANSFAVPFDEDERDKKTWFLDMDYLESMYGMFHKVAARERIVGWYHTGPKLCQNDIVINEQLKRFTCNPVLVVIQAEPKDLGLPTEAYVEVQEVHDDGTPPIKTFEHVPSEIGAEEAEEVGVEHLLRDIKDQTAGTLSQRITDQLMGLRGLHSQLLDLQCYLHEVAEGKLPINHAVIYYIQEVLNLLPDVTSPQFVEAHNVQTNDQLMCVYMGSLVRTVIALHNLIDNKLSLQKNEKDKEKVEGVEKKGESKERKESREMKDNEEGDKEKEKEKDTKKDPMPRAQFSDSALKNPDADKIRPEIKKACKEFILSDDDLIKVSKIMEDEMNKGLRDETSCLKMLPSFVRAVPNGTERGDFLALDLGGTNFRVLLIKLKGDTAEMTGKVYRISEEIMRGVGTALFDHIAQCLADFLEEHNLKKSKELPLGFTFSFPVQQEDLTAGILISWTKGFNAKGVEGQDVVKFLRDACNRRKDISIDVVALLNDTVGTLMACAFKENTCQIGVILGTGTNACYMEKLSNCPKFKKYGFDKDKYPKEMIINIEWGAFGDNGCIDFLRTEFDRDVDNGSINPGKHLFEKMISGMYLGELVRLVLVKLAMNKMLFDGDYEAISKPNCFSTKFVSDIEEQKGFGDLRRTLQILQQIGINRISDSDCLHVAYVCEMISTRAAHLTAAGISCILSRMQKQFVTIGVDGSVYRFHPKFGKILDAKINDLLPKNLDYQLMLSEDGSGRGAALVAAVADRIRKEHG